MANDEAKFATGGRVSDARSRAVFGGNRCTFPTEMFRTLPLDMIPPTPETVSNDPPWHRWVRINTGGGGDGEPREMRIVVDKRVAVIRYENETENEVTIVIERKD